MAQAIEHIATVSGIIMARICEPLSCPSCACIFLFIMRLLWMCWERGLLAIRTCLLAQEFIACSLLGYDIGNFIGHGVPSTAASIIASIAVQYFARFAST